MTGDAAPAPDAGGIVEEATRASPARPPGGVPALPQTIRVPPIDHVTRHSLSQPLLTVLRAALDGFDPCAMWTLVFPIGLLRGMQDRGACSRSGRCSCSAPRSFSSRR
jgi:hypothetical protein